MTKSHAWSSTYIHHTPSSFFELTGMSLFIRLLIDRELNHLQIIVIDETTVRSSFVIISLLTNNTVRRLPCPSTTTVLRDVLIVALGVPVVVVLTHTPLVNEE